MKTFGVVCDVSQPPGLSLTIDYWGYHIEDVITNLDVNYSADQSVATGDPTLCSLMFRYISGLGNFRPRGLATRPLL